MGVLILGFRLIAVVRVGHRFRRGHRDDGEAEPYQQARACREFAEPFRHDLGRLADHFLTALTAERSADAREQQPHVVVDLGRGADGGAWVADGVLLTDRYRRTNPLDTVDVRLLHPLEKLTGVRGQRFHVPALPLRVDGVEGER